MPSGAAVLHALAEAVGAAQVLTAPDALDRYLHDHRRIYHGAALAVVRPGSTAEVAAIVRVCHAARVPMVPQGGNTGYCGGATPDGSGRAVVISLERLNRVLAVDPLAFTMTVEAGVTLAEAQAAAAAHDRLLALSMGSQGSCQIGGNLSTNAGGLAVLKYGTARELVLGLEVVLPDGRVYDKLTQLRKDNTGYDLKQLFVGAEGTLGVITAAVLKLHARAPRATAWASVPTVAAACELLASLRARSGDGVSSFEYVSDAALARIASARPELSLPLSAAGAHQVLIEILDCGAPDLESLLARAHGEGLVDDAVLARSGAQQRALWLVRESIPAAELRLGGSIKHDVSVPSSAIPAFLDEACAALVARWPAARLSVYGHLGDGNIHLNVLAPVAVDADEFKAVHAEAISRLIHDLAHARGGSFSAEHGVGQLKRVELARYGDAVAVDLMRMLKRAIDPLDLMNPGKLIPPAETADDVP